MTSSMAQKIMQSCPNLKDLRVMHLTDEDILHRTKEQDEQSSIEGLHQQRLALLEVAAPWVCTKLEKLILWGILVYPCLAAFFAFTLWLVFFS